MICPHCGRYLEDGVAFCIYCGQRLGKYASDDAAEGSATISLDEPVSAEGPAPDSAAGEDAASHAAHAAAGAVAAGTAAAATSAATAPVAPANAQEDARKRTAAGRSGSRETSRLHADDEIAQRMSDLGDEEKSGRGRKVLGGVILAALAAGAIGFGANYVAPSIMEGGSSSSAASQATTGSSDASSSSSSSSSSKASSSSSAKASSSSKSDAATDTKRGSTLERANQEAEGDESAAGSGAAGSDGAVDETVEAVPTTGEETTTGIVNTYVPASGNGNGNGGSNGSTGWASSNATATATSISPTEGGVTHGPELVLDGRPETAWNTNEDGIGQSITISVDSAKPIAGLKVMNGYNKISASGTDLYYANARAKKILVEYEGGSQEFTLDDLKGEYQTVWFDSDVTTSWVKITIKSVYAGNLYDDCCISEIEVV